MQKSIWWPRHDCIYWKSSETNLLGRKITRVNDFANTISLSNKMILTLLTQFSGSQINRNIIWLAYCRIWISIIIIYYIYITLYIGAPLISWSFYLLGFKKQYVAASYIYGKVRRKNKTLKESAGLPHGHIYTNFIQRQCHMWRWWAFNFRRFCQIQRGRSRTNCESKTDKILT
jgi:hypothetical protein